MKLNAPLRSDLMIGEYAKHVSGDSNPASSLWLLKGGPDLRNIGKMTRTSSIDRIAFKVVQKG
eukprot:m.100745 g.100745  ORF g.100745 m.100745 type:complete len:63 (-) comp13181_c0_seq7:85-273(-)